MPIRTRIEPISRDIEVILAEDLSPKARSAALASFAREAIAEAQETNRRALGRVPPHETHVDGRRGAALDSVKPEGRVDVEFHLFGDVFSFILAELRRLSPVKSGRYRDSHVFFADHTQADPRNPPEDASEYVFLNTQPYARKIEVGKMKMRVPAGVYEQAASSARRRFGNLAKITMNYRHTPSGAVGAWAVSNSGRRWARLKRGGRESLHHEWLTRQPAIIITLA